MVKVERLHWFAVTAILGWIAVVLHCGTNYAWKDGQWDPGMILAVPLAAALPAIAFCFAFKDFNVNARRASYWFFMVINAWSFLMLTMFSLSVLSM